MLRQASALNRSPRITYTSDLALALAAPLDLILSITVLQHVIGNDELREVLRAFRAALKPGGRIAAVETFGPEEQIGSYQHQRRTQSFLAEFEAAGFRLEGLRPFYHPVEWPTSAYRAYRHNPAVQTLSRLSGKVPGTTATLGRIAARYVATDNEYGVPGSPTSILVFRRDDASRDA